MKEFIKSVVPEPIIRKAVAMQDLIQLGMVSKLTFNADKLGLINSDKIQLILSSDEIARFWSEDSKKISSIFGDEDKLEGVNPGDRRCIYSLIMGMKPKNVLEVGTHIGASTIHIAMAMKSAGYTGEIVTADILDVNDQDNGSWKRVGMRKPPSGYVKDLGCDDMISFHTGPCVSFMSNTAQKFDLIFLDGDHHAAAVYQEISVALNILNMGGVILLHDYYPDGCPIYSGRGAISGPYLAMKRIIRENNEIDVIPLGALPWPTKLGSNVTTLAMVIRKA